MALQGRSSLNSALANASMALESRQAEKEEISEEQNGGGQIKSVNGSAGYDSHGRIGSLLSLTTMVDSDSIGKISDGRNIVFHQLAHEMAIDLAAEPFESSELELIEAALTTLRSAGRQLDAAKAEEEIGFTSNDQQDMQKLARLLQKVQAVKARKTCTSFRHTTSSLIESSMQGPPGGEDLESADIRLVVVAAAQAALAAAKIAESLVSSLDRNSQTIETLCRELTGRESPRIPVGETTAEVEEDDGRTESSPHISVGETAAKVEEDDERTEGSDNEAKFLAIEILQTEIARSLVRQNRVTHWVLGFIVVSALVWRCGVIKFVKKASNSIQNPFQGIIDRFSPKKDHTEHSEHTHTDLQFRLPGFLGGQDDTEHHKLHAKQETAEQDTTFNLGNIFQGEEPEVCKQVKQQVQQAKDDGRFNLGNILKINWR